MKVCDIWKVLCYVYSPVLYWMIEGLNFISWRDDVLGNHQSPAQLLYALQLEL